MKILNNLIKIIIIIVSFTYSLSILETSNFYNAIIKLSIIPFLFIPQILNKLKIIKFTNSIEFIYLIFLFLAHFLGSIVDFYHQVPNYDTLMHFLSGILVSIIATMLIKQNNINQNKLFFNKVVLMFQMVFFIWDSSLSLNFWVALILSSFSKFSDFMSRSLFIISFNRLL